MKHQLMLILGILVFINCSQTPQFDKPIDDAIVAFKEKWELPGISVAIAKNGKLFYAKGFGYSDTVNHEPVTVNSLFRIASCSKAITAIGIMKLYEDGLLSLDGKVFGVDGILNEYENISDKQVLDITVKNLLQQTIAWPHDNTIGGNEAAFQLGKEFPATIDDIITYNLTREIDSTANGQFRYSNLNYLLLGRIIEKVSKQGYEEYMNSLLQPIGVTSIKLGKTLREDRFPDEVIYYDIPEVLEKSVFDTTKMLPLSYGGFNMQTVYSAGGLIAKPVDIVRIICAIDGLDSKADILSSKTLELMKSKPEGIESPYGMGLAIIDDGFFHDGALTWGTSSVMYYSGKDSISFAITVNTLPQTGEGYMGELRKLVPAALESVTDIPKEDLFKTH